MSGFNVRQSNVAVIGATADTSICLIDLDDTTNWKHGKTDHAIIHGWDLSLLVNTAKTWVAYLGVVTENDATDGTIAVIDLLIANEQDVFVHKSQWIPGGLDLALGSGALLHHNLTPNANNVALKNDVNFTTPSGGNALIEAGDVVLLLDEVEDAANVIGVFTVWYTTE